MERKTNNFGFLRLLFAILVILAHSPELIDGNRTRELLTRIFGTVSFGTIGVDGFFLISGYLITKSFLQSESTFEYLLKRVLRIYPGYIIAFLFCLLVVGPFAGGHLSDLSITSTLGHMLTLKAPQLEGAFEGTSYPSLNGSMWTIAYEFRCYLLVLALGVAGLFSKRPFILVGSVVALSLSVIPISVFAHPPQWMLGLLGYPEYTLRLTGIFGCGALFYLYRDRIQYNWKIALAAGCGMAILLFSQTMAEIGLAIFGGYVLFWFAFNFKSPVLASVGQKMDLSYGVYLYAFPVQKLLIWAYPGISPWSVFAVATVISGLFAWASWRLIEKPFLNLKTAFVQEPAVARPEVSLSAAGNCT
jgi:peptidoglycan/LPS O-acetylase OafA/YrhL